MGFSPQDLLPIVERLPRPSCYWMAFSGGLDSTVLLHALSQLRRQLPAPLKAVHLDHGLHADSAQWADHCRRLCRELDLPLEERALQLQPPPGASIEAEARKARLAAFRAIIGPGDLLLTAQHRDDQAETLLLQLLRGSGLSGLAAMPALTELPPGYLARPLLGFTREDLHDYAERCKLRWVEDPSNAETGFDRNYLRHRVLPLLAERWPAYAKTLSRSARHCAEAQGLIDHLAERDFTRVRGGRPASLSVSALAELDAPLCRALLRRWIRERGFSTANSRRLDRIIHELLRAAPDRSPVVEWPGAEVRRYRDDLFLLPPLPEPPGNGPIDWRAGPVFALPAGLGVLRITAPAPDDARPPASLQVRFGVAGARCGMAGRGGHKSLKKVFQEHGVPDWVRPYVPLLYLNAELAAVGGFCRCAGPPLQQVVWEGHPFAQILP
jgi:tRNA(Ile)-lysidine synthase